MLGNGCERYLYLKVDCILLKLLFIIGELATATLSLRHLERSAFTPLAAIRYTLKHCFRLRFWPLYQIEIFLVTQVMIEDRGNRFFHDFLSVFDRNDLSYFRIDCSLLAIYAQFAMKKKSFVFLI